MNNENPGQNAHSRRTAALAAEIGRQAGLPVEPLIHAARLHHSLQPLRHSRGLGRLAWQVIAGHNSRTIANIILVCNLLDEQLESLEFEHKETDTILDEIQSFTALEGFDPSVVDHLRGMRFRGLPGTLQLPVEGAAACHVFRALRANREFEIRELEAMALRDPVLTGNLLGVANSALHGRRHRISNVGRAIATLGVLEARKILLATAIRPLFASAGLGLIWSHSLSSAPLCSALANHTGLLTPEEGLILGLVHDIGAVAATFLPRETAITRGNLINGGCPATYVERLLLGRDHGEIGADLIADWLFPESFSEAVRFHHQPERSTSKLPALAYLAEFWSGLDEDLPSFGRVEDCLSRLDLTYETLMELAPHDSTLHALKAVA